MVSGINNLIAIICAGGANLYFMRRKEIKDGVIVFDHEGNAHGKSLVAGKKAIAQTIYSRVAVVTVIVTAGPLAAIYMLESRRMLNNRVINAMVQYVLCMAGLGIGLPLGVAIFPQQGRITSERLESQFRGLKDSRGQSIEYLYFNKGL